MKLDPSEYTCPEHHVDLTSQVEDALDDADGPPLAYWRLPLTRKAAGPRPFEVPVTCPGGSGGRPHQFICSGTYTP
jgi:hypothetical protein